MRLLVSVRSAEEAAAALEGGADVIDAKEPGLGALGAVSPAVLLEIADCVPTGVPLSLALGDLGSPAAVRRAITQVALARRKAPIYLKLGFGQVDSPSEVARLLKSAVLAMGSSLPGGLLIAAAYADHTRAGALPPAVISSLAVEAGAAGVLLDTAVKDGRGLLEWLPRPALGQWISEVRGAGLLAALAGSLAIEVIPLVVSLRPDILGVRGAACDGGREGRVSPSRVRRLKARVATSEASLAI
ncbi:MAG: (5-formylfuran-3-yl)methyl phosphate synthase [Gemmatimonadales bacterium]